MRLLVTGASGLLGMNLACQAASRHVVTGTVNANHLSGVPFDVRAADLSTQDDLERLLDAVQPEAILHTAALAYPEKCEENPDLAERLNACLPGWVASAAVRAGIPLLHVSTDAVFDGVQGGYGEDDLPNPRNLYARTKLAGERAVAEIDPRALIIRTVFYGWSLSGQRSLAEWFYTNLAAGNRIRGFTDAFFCPLIAGDLAGLLLEMLERGLTGVYHVVSPESISKYDFGVRIARLFGFDEGLIAPASVADSGLKAARSANLSLRGDKLIRDLGTIPPGQAAGLQKFYQQYRDGIPEKIRRMGSSKVENRE